MANAHKRQGNYATAVELCQRALSQDQAAGCRAGQVADHELLADLFFLQGDYARCQEVGEQGMSLAELEANDIDAGAWPILLDANGHLTEGSGYNVFIATDGILRTPTDHAALVGVSRMMALDLAEQLEIPASEEDLEPYDLFTADECFFSSTPFSLLPVTRVDGREIGDGKPGPMTQQLLAAWSESVGIDIVGQAEAAAAQA